MTMTLAVEWIAFGALLALALTVTGVILRAEFARFLPSGRRAEKERKACRETMQQNTDAFVTEALAMAAKLGVRAEMETPVNSFNGHLLLVPLIRALLARVEALEAPRQDIRHV